VSGIVGATREAVSRALGGFERQKAVRLERGRIVVLDRAVLVHAATT
jgi:CRP-like cAMP-binding protein